MNKFIITSIILFLFSCNIQTHNKKSSNKVLLSKLKIIDKKLNDIKFSHTTYITPISKSIQVEKLKFFNSIKIGKIYNPILKYKKIDKSKIQKIIKKLESINIPANGIYKLFYELRNWKINMAKLVLYRDSLHFSKMSLKVYPYINKKLITFAYNVLEKINLGDLIQEKANASHLDLKYFLDRKLVEHNLDDWKVKLSYNNAARLSIRAKKKLIIIRKGELFDRRFFNTYFNS